LLPIALPGKILRGGTDDGDEYLKNARECAELAERMTGGDNRRLLAIADAWLELGKSAAEVVAGVPLAPVLPKT
jgi:hypothetical protein